MRFNHPPDCTDFVLSEFHFLIWDNSVASIRLSCRTSLPSQIAQCLMNLISRYQDYMDYVTKYSEFEHLFVFLCLFSLWAILDRHCLIFSCEPIEFVLNLKESTTEAYPWLVEAYGQTALSGRSWFNKVMNGEFANEDKEISGRPNIYEEPKIGSIIVGIRPKRKRKF